MKIYKPNPRSTGACCSFSITSSGKSQGVYVEILKQKGWDDKNKTGSFDTEKANKINLKFTPSEVAEMMIICQRQKGSATFFHKTTDVTSSIKFYVYNKRDSEIPAGIALSVSKGEKKASIPLTFPEAFLLARWFDFATTRMFTADYAAEKKRIEKLMETKLES